jgi:hypothetical protein
MRTGGDGVPGSAAEELAKLELLPDGEVTATGPRGQVLRSRPPPGTGPPGTEHGQAITLIATTRPAGRY